MVYSRSKHITFKIEKHTRFDIFLKWRNNIFCFQTQILVLTIQPLLASISLKRSHNNFSFTELQFSRCVTTFLVCNMNFTMGFCTFKVALPDFDKKNAWYSNTPLVPLSTNKPKIHFLFSNPHLNPRVWRLKIHELISGIIRAVWIPCMYPSDCNPNQYGLSTSSEPSKQQAVTGLINCSRNPEAQRERKKRRRKKETRKMFQVFSFPKRKLKKINWVSLRVVYYHYQCLFIKHLQYCLSNQVTPGPWLTHFLVWE